MDGCLSRGKEQRLLQAPTYPVMAARVLDGSVPNAKALVAGWCMGAKVMPGWYQGGGDMMLNGINTAISAVTSMMTPVNAPSPQQGLNNSSSGVAQAQPSATQALHKGGSVCHYHHSTKTHPPPMALNGSRSKAQSQPRQHRPQRHQAITMIPVVHQQSSMIPV